VAKKYRDVRKALRDDGWRLLRQRGSHEVWAHPARHGRVILAGKNSDMVPVGILSRIRRDTGLKELR